MPVPEFDPKDLTTWAKALVDDHARRSGRVAHQIAKRTWVEDAITVDDWRVLQNIDLCRVLFVILLDKHICGFSSQQLTDVSTEAKCFRRERIIVSPSENHDDRAEFYFAQPYIVDVFTIFTEFVMWLRCAHCLHDRYAEVPPDDCAECAVTHHSAETIATNLPLFLDRLWEVATPLLDKELHYGSFHSFEEFLGRWTNDELPIDDSYNLGSLLPRCVEDLKTISEECAENAQSSRTLSL